MASNTWVTLLPVSILSALAAVGCGSSAAVAARPASRPEIVADAGSLRTLPTGAPVSAASRLVTARVAAKQSPVTRDELAAVPADDCSKGGKVCTAKGFVYDKVSPAMPEINARTMVSEASDAKGKAADAELAHR